MNIVLEELAAGLPDTTQMVRVTIRLITAMLLGAVVGVQRERTGKAAGLRTHMLVAMGAALFVLVASEVGMSVSDVSRVIQGLATGIGFIGGGAILKLREEHKIQGLITAAGIWMTAAIGVAAGLGRLGMVLLSVVLTWLAAAWNGKQQRPKTRGIDLWRIFYSPNTTACRAMLTRTKTIAPNKAGKKP